MRKLGKEMTFLFNSALGGGGGGGGREIRYFKSVQI